MLSSVWSPSKLGEQNHGSKKRSAFVGSSYNIGSVDVGSRILIHQLSKGDSNVILKSSLKFRKPLTFRINRIPSCRTHDACFLKSCFPCNNNLSPDKDVYMYRGDQGFCSVECRNRQIYLDDLREMEASTKKILASSFRHCRTSGRCCETSSPLGEEFRQRRKPLSRAKDRARAIFS